MRNIQIIIFLFSSIFYAQNNYTNTRDSIYMDKGLYYNVNKNSLFNGTIQFVKKNGVIKSKEFYEKGILKKILFYYNKSAKGKVYKEIQFNYEHQNYTKQKEIDYNSDGYIYKIKYFESGELKNLELYKNGKMTYSCEYRNGKKHGVEYCYDDKNDLIQFRYEKGKKIK